MSFVNGNFENLAESYLFAEVARRVERYKQENAGADVISLGIGDVTLPLAPAVISAMKSAADEMGRKSTFRGYGPYEGYGFLREAIASYYKKELGVVISQDEVFIGDGAKNDLGAILDLFRAGSSVLVPDPVYPAYVDANVIRGNSVKYLQGEPCNDFLPAAPDERSDIVYICSPNNPTGAVYGRDALKAWADWANENGAVILFDAAYERFVSDASLPRSIFEIEGAKECAIEFCSFSKTAGFTGVRCGYTVIPKLLKPEGSELNGLWRRRAAALYNGTSYVIQRAAAAVFTPEGEAQIKQAIDYYRANAVRMAQVFDGLGISYTGGVNSPYIWFSCPACMGSWETFDLLLEKGGVVCTPGAGFGSNGEGRCRLTAFGDAERTKQAMERIACLLGSIGR